MTGDTNELNDTNCSESNDKTIPRSILKEFANDTTLHGLKHTLNSDRHTTENRINKFRQIIWILFFFSSFIGCVGLLTVCIRNYFNYDFVTSITHVENNTLAFPAVTVCNVQVGRKHMDIPIFKEYMFSRLDPNSTISKNESLKLWYEEELKKLSGKSLYGKMHLTLDETVMYCVFADKAIPCSEYFTASFTEYGVCFTFNSNKFIKRNGTMKTDLAGHFYGLQVILDTKTEIMSDMVRNIGAGYFILVHHPDSYPLMSKQSFLVSPGYEVHVGLTKEINKKLSTPYSNKKCLNKGRNYADHVYSQALCWHLCYEDFVYANSCSLHLDIKPEKPECSAYHEITYAFNQYIHTGNILKTCDKCLPTCENIHFKHSLSSIILAEDSVKVKANENDWPSKNFTYIKNNYVFLNIYYETMEYTFIEQKPMTSFQSILSDIGGLLGIFLGASIVTLAEVVEYTVKVISRYCCKHNSVHSITMK